MNAHPRLALTIAFGLALAGCQAPTSSPAPSASGPSWSTSARAASTADVMFAQMMIPHHEQAVVMSDAMLAKPDIASEVTTLATQIKNAQQPEIDQMRGWLKTWGASEQGDHHGHTGMDGMLTDQELDALKSAQGTQAEKLFLTGMIKHHEGAVAMAKEVQANGADPGVRTLADAIITGQQAEIDQMKKLLAAR
jgi:uncharacterized protein (DUF305 family)